MRFYKMLLWTIYVVPAYFLGTEAWLFKTKNHAVTATGCVRCYNDPMPYVKIKLMDKDSLFDDHMGTARANSNGCFTVHGSGRDGLTGTPEPFIRVEYEYSGYYGKMEVEYIVFGKNRHGKTSHRSYSRNVNFGTFRFSSIHCKAYVLFYNAMKDFKSRSGETLPGGYLHVRTGVLIHGGTPYATTNIVRIPNSYSASQLTYATAKHELAHIFRHRYDGNGAHFSWDAVRFWYMRSHTCATNSNYGYAFNEGWAEYWARTCLASSYGGSATNYKIEGNVANGLRRLSARCPNTRNDARFVQVLKRNRGNIHSFHSFNYRFKQLYNCGF